MVVTSRVNTKLAKGNTDTDEVNFTCPPSSLFAGKDSTVGRAAESSVLLMVSIMSSTPWIFCRWCPATRTTEQVLGAIIP